MLNNNNHLLNVISKKNNKKRPNQNIFLTKNLNVFF